MSVLVTIGPTQEPLDAMRILSNRSTGRLGTQLALTMAQAGHKVVALRGTGATASSSELIQAGVELIPFTTTEDLGNALELLSKTTSPKAIFHAAAVSDFYYPEAGNGKIPSSAGSLTLTLQPTPKLLPRLRIWFPQAQIIGWKFEASGDKESALSAAQTQIIKNKTDGCVLNGPSYGEGFGYVSKAGNFQHLANPTALCAFLTEKI